MRIPSLVAVLLLIAAPSAADQHQEDASKPVRTIGLPHAALSLDVPDGWKITQFDGSIIDLRKEGARLWVYAGQRGDDVEKRITEQAARLKRTGGVTTTTDGWKAAGAVVGARIWYDTDAEHRCVGALARADTETLSVEALAPRGPKALLGDVRALMDSFDLRPFEHRRIVEWTQRWTLDPSRFWTAGDAQNGMLRLERAERAAGIEAYVGRTNGQAIEILKRRKAFRDAQLLFKPPTPPKDGVTETDIVLRPKKAGDPERRIWHLRAGELEAVLVYPATQDEGLAEAITEDKAMLRTLRDGTHPGSQREAKPAAERLRFPRKGGPPLTFELPKGWAIGDPSNAMRLGDLRIEGDPVLMGAVYWFGPNQGGTVEANFARWARQFGAQPPAASKPQDISEGIRATTLDLSDDARRMLATVMEIPQGKVFFKFVGDKGAMDKMAASYQAFLKSFRAE